MSSRIGIGLENWAGLSGEPACVALVGNPLSSRVPLSAANAGLPPYRTGHQHSRVQLAKQMKQPKTAVIVVKANGSDRVGQ